jgi:hypothetical protein
MSRVSGRGVCYYGDVIVVGRVVYIPIGKLLGTDRHRQDSDNISLYFSFMKESRLITYSVFVS